MKYLKTFEGGSGFGKSYPDHEEPTPRFNIGDEVVVMFNLMKFMRLYGIFAGDIVTILDFWINDNGDISYKVDSPKIREIKKGLDTSDDYFDEFYFDYEWNIAANKYNL